MATITVSIGSNSSIVTQTPNSCSGFSSPWVVTLVGAPTGVNPGDAAIIVDAAQSATYTFLVTAVSGYDVTLRYISDDSSMGDTSPCSMYNAMFSQASITFRRFYSTITLWEAGLDSTPLYASSDDAVGLCYDDSAFNESVIINGGATVGLSSRKLSVASGERHDGTANNGGARIVRSADVDDVIYVTIPDTTVEWLQVDMGGNECVKGCFRTDTNNTTLSTIANCIAHNIDATTSHSRAYWAQGNTDILNCIAYDVTSTGTSGYADFFKMNSNSTYATQFLNCTGYKSRNDSTSGNTNAFTIKNHSNKVCKNCISVDVAGSSFGTTDCFSEGATSVFGYNLSSDSTATGTGSLTGKAAADQFVSISEGSEDLHLKSGADAIDAGTDLGDVPAAIDIDGRNRHAEDDAYWDIGADEFYSSSVDDDVSPAALSAASTVEADPVVVSRTIEVTV
jgi:hypothetical protein